MSDWRWFWVSPRLFLIRSFRSYQAHQDKHQTFFAIVRVISITSVSWMFCTSVVWPVYDSIVKAFRDAFYGTSPKDEAAAAEETKSKSKRNNGTTGKQGAGVSTSSDSCGERGPSSTAAKKFAADEAKKIARGPSRSLAAAEISARAQKASRRAGGRKHGQAQHQHASSCE